MNGFILIYFIGLGITGGMIAGTRGSIVGSILGLIIGTVLDKRLKILDQ